jgi:hypothetical protein
MSFTGLGAFQAAVVTALRADATLLALLGGANVFDEVPARQTFPYVAFDDPMEVPDRSFGLNGHSITATLTVYTQDGSATKAGRGAAGFKQGITIADAVLAVLVDESKPYIAVAGHAVTNLDVEAVVCARMPDGITRTVEITLVALLEDSGA